MFLPCPTDVPAQIRAAPLASIDLGFSNSRRTTGLCFDAADGHDLRGRNVRFNEAVAEVNEWLTALKSPGVLIVEAPLSSEFDGVGNPCPRWFEVPQAYSADSLLTEPRPWYTGAGVTTLAASNELFKRLGSPNQDVYLIEGFYPNLESVTSTQRHIRDAENLARRFRNAENLLRPHAQPLEGRCNPI
jgi:hypothetical protein